MSTNDQNLTQPSNQTLDSDFHLFNKENTTSSHIYISFEHWRQILHIQVETRLACPRSKIQNFHFLRFVQDFEHRQFRHQLI